MLSKAIFSYYVSWGSKASDQNVHTYVVTLWRQKQQEMLAYSYLGYCYMKIATEFRKYVDKKRYLRTYERSFKGWFFPRFSLKMSQWLLKKRPTYFQRSLWMPCFVINKKRKKKSPFYQIIIMSYIYCHFGLKFPSY